VVISIDSIALRTMMVLSMEERLPRKEDLLSRSGGRSAPVMEGHAESQADSIIREELWAVRNRSTI
jgi:hypothetical protein